MKRRKRSAGVQLASTPNPILEKHMRGGDDDDADINGNGNGNGINGINGELDAMPDDDADDDVLDEEANANGNGERTLVIDANGKTDATPVIVDLQRILGVQMADSNKKSLLPNLYRASVEAIRNKVAGTGTPGTLDTPSMPGMPDAAFGISQPITGEQVAMQAAAARAEQISEARGQAVTDELFDSESSMGANAVDKFNRAQRSSVMRAKARRLIKEIQASNIAPGATDGWWVTEILRQDPGICTEEQMGEFIAIVQDLLDPDIIKKTATQSASMSMTPPGAAMSEARGDYVANQLMGAPRVR
jgi:hypothetical protein